MQSIVLKKQENSHFSTSLSFTQDLAIDIFLTFKAWVDLNPH